MAEFNRTRFLVDPFYKEVGVTPDAGAQQPIPAGGTVPTPPAVSPAIQSSGTVPQPGTPSPTSEGHTIEQKYSTYNPATQKFDKQVHVFSATGNRQPLSAFHKALEQYEQNGNRDPEGFVVVDVGSRQEATWLNFEKVNRPVQDAAQRYSKAPLTTGGIAMPVEMLLKAAAPPLTSTFNTPEKASVAAGTALAGAATGSMSLPLQAGIMGLTAGVSSLGSQYATKSNINLPEALQRAGTEAVIAGVTGGGVGVLKYALGRNVSARAQEQMANRIVTYIKTHYKDLVNDSKTIEALIATDKGLRDLVQIGVSGIIGDFGTTGGALLASVRSAVGRNLTAGASRSVNTNIARLGNAATEMLENIGNPTEQRILLGKITAAQRDILATVSQYYHRVGTGNTVPATTHLAAINDLMEQYTAKMQEFVPTLSILRSLEKSQRGGKYNPKLFQESMQELSQTAAGHAGQTYRAMADIAGQSTYRNLLPAEQLGKGIAQMLGFNPVAANIAGKVPAIGALRMYPHVKGTLPTTTGVATAGASSAISDFLGREKRPMIDIEK